MFGPSQNLKQLLLDGSVLGVRTAAGLLPLALVRRLFRSATAGLGVSLCLHRVAARPPRGHPCSAMTLDPRVLDCFLDLCGRDRPADGSPPLVMAFDDGYADAAAYVRSRAQRYPEVEFLFFVCPEKLEKRVGYRWDLYALEQADGRTRLAYQDYLDAELDPERENQRHELCAVAARDEFRLASVDDCKDLMRLPNVTLGSHTDLHFDLCLLSDEQAQSELLHSTLRFEALFGRPLTHFAFPFGGHGRIRAAHVAFLRRIRNPVMWSTRWWPYASDVRAPGSVLPRFVFERDFSAAGMALWIAAQALRYRLAPREENEVFAEAREQGDELSALTQVAFATVASPSAQSAPQSPLPLAAAPLSASPAQPPSSLSAASQPPASAV